MIVLRSVEAVFALFGIVMAGAMAISGYKLRRTRVEKCSKCGQGITVHIEKAGRP
jgi:hypothetical protein